MYLLSYIRGDFVYCPVLLVLFTYIRGDFVYCPVLLVLFTPRELLLFSLIRFFPLQNGLAQRAIFIGKAQNSRFFEPRRGGI